jgi:hypothetical protein
MLLSSSEWKAEAASLLKYLLRVCQTARYHIRYLLINCETTGNLIIITTPVTLFNIAKPWVLSMQLMSVYFVIFSNQNTVNCRHKSHFFLKLKYFYQRNKYVSKHILSNRIFILYNSRGIMYYCSCSEYNVGNRRRLFYLQGVHYYSFACYKRGLVDRPEKNLLS